MPERKELEVLTSDLKPGDVVKKYPDYRNNILFGKHLKQIDDRWNAWVTLVFEDFELPKTKRFKANTYWTIWRDVLTEVEIAEQAIKKHEESLFRLCNRSLERLKEAQRRAAEIDLEVYDPADVARKLMEAAAERRIWSTIVLRWENRNKQKAAGANLEDVDPFWHDDRDWGIGEAVYSWCLAQHDELLRGRMGFRQTWNDPVVNIWRTMEAQELYKQSTGDWSSLWHHAKQWHEDYMTLKEARNASS